MKQVIITADADRITIMASPELHIHDVMGLLEWARTEVHLQAIDAIRESEKGKADRPLDGKTSDG